MNFLSLFVLIPLLMLFSLWLAKGQKGIRTVMVVGSSALLALAVALTVKFISDRAGGAAEEMLYTASFVWFEPLHISYSVGVDGISVVMLLLSGVIVFTGTFVSWDMCKEYFLWFTLLSMGVFGFFISVDLFMMFMFYEIALIPMYLLIGVWGSGHKEYSAMKLTLMLMGASAFLMLGIPISDGTLPAIQLQLGDVNGTPALLTNLTNDECTYRVKFRLYTAVQTLENGFMPRVRFNMREVRWSEMTLVDGHMVLVGKEFADVMKGWALVRVIDDRCSPQTIVTRCTLYEQYTTDEALQTAAKSYGGLTETPFPSPR